MKKSILQQFGKSCLVDDEKESFSSLYEKLPYCSSSENPVSLMMKRSLFLLFMKKIPHRSGSGIPALPMMKKSLSLGFSGKRA